MRTAVYIMRSTADTVVRSIVYQTRKSEKPKTSFKRNPPSRPRLPNYVPRTENLQILRLWSPKPKQHVKVGHDRVFTLESHAFLSKLR